MLYVYRDCVMYRNMLYFMVTTCCPPANLPLKNHPYSRLLIQFSNTEVNQL
jgi:hypothetical protein